jgi:hypothetical protein
MKQATAKNVLGLTKQLQNTDLKEPTTHDVGIE